MKLSWCTSRLRCVCLFVYVCMTQNLKYGFWFQYRRLHDGDNRQGHNGTKLHFPPPSCKLKDWWKTSEEICVYSALDEKIGKKNEIKQKKPWRPSDFIINNSAFIGKVICSEVTFRNWISNWQTGEIFLISWTISLWCIHYRGTVTSLITQNNVRVIPETTLLAMHSEFKPPPPSVPDVIALQLNNKVRRQLGHLAKCASWSDCMMFYRRRLPHLPHPLNLWVCPLSFTYNHHASLCGTCPEKSVFVCLPPINLLEIKEAGRESC